MRNAALLLLLAVFLVATLGGCANMSERERNVAGGAALGAAAGQAIGQDTESTLIGTGVGAVGGALVPAD